MKRKRDKPKTEAQTPDKTAILKALNRIAPICDFKTNDGLQGYAFNEGYGVLGCAIFEGRYQGLWFDSEPNWDKWNKAEVQLPIPESLEDLESAIDKIKQLQQWEDLSQ